MTAALKNWIPYHIGFEAENWHVDWLDLGNHHIKEPFFDETISLCRAKMLNRSRFSSRSNLVFLTEVADRVSGMEPTAFIFHVSRCGSTLLSQTLSLDQDHIVIAEAPVFDHVLRMREKDSGLSEEEIKVYFFALIKLMGQSRSGREKNYFIKLDSWHLHFYPMLRAWFPQTPFYFLSREPGAVLASHHKKRGIHSIPGYIVPALFNMELTPLHFENFDFYTAEVLVGYYDALKAYQALNFPHNYFYDYSWGMKAMPAHFFKSIGQQFAHQEMMGRINFHSKFPDVPFQEELKPDPSFHYDFAKAAYLKFYETLSIHG
ncbi:MAG: hypothetical protein EOO20_17870 [Chryseobacterium sp.]|nr:MAG: hypothetical protein EOO20_17870 [Chryseobacterium sp.]